MAKLNTKVVIVDSKWSVIVTNNEWSVLYFAGASKKEAEQADKQIRYDINRHKLDMQDFSSCKQVFERLSNRNKTVYTTTPPT